MKKIIIGALALAVIGFGSVVGTKANVKNGPDMKISTQMKKIEGYKDIEFDLNVDIDTGIIKSKDVSNKSLKDIKIILNDITNFDITSVTGIIKNHKSEEENTIVGTILNSTVNIGSFDYIYNDSYEGSAGTLKYNLKGPEVNLNIKLKAKEAKNNQNINLKELIKLEYFDIDENKSEGTFEEGAYIPINIVELDYKIGYIKGVADTSTSFTPKIGQYFDLEYNINPGELVNKVTEERLALENNPRNMIYVIDKATIDKVGANDEIARDSIIKSLEELQQSEPQTQCSLIVYGESAEIIKVNDKSIFSIGELISQISSIEGTDKSGNLGDAIRMTQVLINETENEDSVILVSNGDSNYYTQVSEGNKTILSTRVDKRGFAIEDREKAEEYASDVVKDIVLNEEDNTRWYAVNYGLENEEFLVNELIDLLEGETLEVKRPYYADFSMLNENAVAPLIIEGKLVATLADERKKSLEIHPKDVEQNIKLIFNRGENNKLSTKEIPAKIRLRVNNTEAFTEEEKKGLGIDIANPENLKVELKVNFNEKEQIHIFNSPNNKPDENQGVNNIIWYLKPVEPYFARVGLFSGELDTNRLTNVEDFIDSRPEFELAEKNYFSVGMMIKPKSNIESIIPQKRNNKNNTKGTPFTEGIKVYKLDDKNKFIEYTDRKYIPNETYLMVIDYYIDGAKVVGEVPGQSFEIGFEVESGEEKDFWGVKVNVVDKPEHF